MPFTQPTRAEILQRIKADMRVELGFDPLRRSTEYALARALTSQSKGHYGNLDWIFRQCFPDTADEMHFWRWASVYGITQKPATPWQGSYTFTGTDTTFIPAGTSLTRSDGTTYTTDGDVTISGTSIVAALTATVSGQASNCEDAQHLNLTTPIVGVDAEGVVGSTTHTGADAEDALDGLVRLLERLQNPPSGGGPGDYVRWALEVDGVTRAWEFPLLEGPNSVSVAFVRDDDGSGTAILPDSTERAAVLAHLQASAPITVDVRVITLTALVVDVTLTALVPNTSEAHTAIAASLGDLLFRDGAPGRTIARSQVDAAVSDARGETSHVMSIPAGDVVSTTAQIPILGTVTYP